MKVVVERVGRFSFAVLARGHLITADQPEANGGTDTSMTPPELFLASLGTCVGYYVAEYLETSKLNDPDLEIDVTGEILKSPGRIGNISIDVKLPFDLEQDRLRALLRVAAHCTISNTLAHPPQIDIQIPTPSPAVADRP